MVRSHRASGGCHGQFKQGHKIHNEPKASHTTREARTKTSKLKKKKKFHNVQYKKLV